MTSTKFYINFYPPPMARIDTYQYNILSSRSVRHHIVKKILKMVSSYHQVWKEACSFLGFTVWNNPSHKLTLNPQTQNHGGLQVTTRVCCSWFWVLGDTRVVALDTWKLVKCMNYKIRTTYHCDFGEL